MKDNSILSIEIGKAAIEAAMRVVAQYEGQPLAARMAALDYGLMVAAFTARRGYAHPDKAAAAEAMAIDLADIVARVD